MDGRARVCCSTSTVVSNYNIDIHLRRSIQTDHLTILQKVSYQIFFCFDEEQSDSPKTTPHFDDTTMDQINYNLIYCNSCFKPITRNRNIRYFMTLCGKVICIVCEQRNGRNVCMLCKQSECKHKELTAKMNPENLAYFKNITPLKKMCEFQKYQMKRYENFCDILFKKKNRLHQKNGRNECEKQKIQEKIMTCKSYKIKSNRPLTVVQPPDRRARSVFNFGIRASPNNHFDPSFIFQPIIGGNETRSIISGRSGNSGASSKSRVKFEARPFHSTPIHRPHTSQKKHLFKNFLLRPEERMT